MLGFLALDALNKYKDPSVHSTKSSTAAEGGSVPGQGVSLLAAAAPCRKWMLRVGRFSGMTVTDSGYPGEALNKN